MEIKTLNSNPFFSILILVQPENISSIQLALDIFLKVILPVDHIFYISQMAPSAKIFLRFSCNFLCLEDLLSDI